MPEDTKNWPADANATVDVSTLPSPGTLLDQIPAGPPPPVPPKFPITSGSDSVASSSNQSPVGLSAVSRLSTGPGVGAADGLSSGSDHSNGKAQTSPAAIATAATIPVAKILVATTPPALRNLMDDINATMDQAISPVFTEVPAPNFLNSCDEPLPPIGVVPPGIMQAFRGEQLPMTLSAEVEQDIQRIIEVLEQTTAANAISSNVNAASQSQTPTNGPPLQLTPLSTETAIGGGRGTTAVAGSLLDPGAPTFEPAGDTRSNSTLTTPAANLPHDSSTTDTKPSVAPTSASRISNSNDLIEKLANLVQKLEHVTPIATPTQLEEANTAGVPQSMLDPLELCLYNCDQYCQRVLLQWHQAVATGGAAGGGSMAFGSSCTAPASALPNLVASIGRWRNVNVTLPVLIPNAELHIVTPTGSPSGTGLRQNDAFYKFPPRVPKEYDNVFGANVGRYWFRQTVAGPEAGRRMTAATMLRTRVAVIHKCPDFLVPILAAMFQAVAANSCPILSAPVRMVCDRVAACSVQSRGADLIMSEFPYQERLEAFISAATSCDEQKLLDILLVLCKFAEAVNNQLRVLTSNFYRCLACVGCPVDERDLVPRDLYNPTTGAAALELRFAPSKQMKVHLGSCPAIGPMPLRTDISHITGIEICELRLEIERKADREFDPLFWELKGIQVPAKGILHDMNGSRCGRAVLAPPATIDLPEVKFVQSNPRLEESEPEMTEKSTSANLLARSTFSPALECIISASASAAGSGSSVAVNSAHPPTTSTSNAAAVQAMIYAQRRSRGNFDSASTVTGRSGSPKATSMIAGPHPSPVASVTDLGERSPPVI